MIIFKRVLTAHIYKFNQFVAINKQTRLVTTAKSIIYANKQNEMDDEKSFFNKSLLISNLPVVVKPSLFDNIKEKLGMQGSLRYKQMQLKIAAMRIYLCISYQVNYDTFYKKLDMPDVMYSFCLVTFFHVWMVSVALMQYGHSGLFVRKCLHEFMWKDIETRAKKLQATMNKEIKLKTYQHLNDVFRGHLFGFDEGLLGDDTVLAGAVWRHLFEMKEIKDYAILGEMCDYIRKNVDHLENISDKDLLSNGIISLLDFNQKKLDHSQVRPKIYEMIRKKESE